MKEGIECNTNVIIAEIRACRQRIGSVQRAAHRSPSDLPLVRFSFP